MSRSLLGCMLEFPRGDRCVVESRDLAWDVYRVRWIRGGRLTDPQITDEVDGRSIHEARVIERMAP